MNCSQHVERSAIALCNQCMRGVCTDCCAEVAGRPLCPTCGDRADELAWRWEHHERRWREIEAAEAKKQEPKDAARPCSFCERDLEAVYYLIEGATAAICDDCVGECRHFLAWHTTEERPRWLAWLLGTRLAHPTIMRRHHLEPGGRAARRGDDDAAP